MVTGVQTCALPISAGAGIASSLVSKQLNKQLDFESKVESNVIDKIRCGGFQLLVMHVSMSIVDCRDFEDNQTRLVAQNNGNRVLICVL